MFYVHEKQGEENLEEVRQQQKSIHVASLLGQNPNREKNLARRRWRKYKSKFLFACKWHKLILFWECDLCFSYTVALVGPHPVFIEMALMSPRGGRG